ncbi:MAG: DUF4832 domain-containing protein [Bryobacterales bacterium]|nr:DUF4832 domain-containing protein [Bryobacteraceae bacterium]MDW8131175.1 DUF4832 domain-containing protein [Bryobacterales bacterium]
MTFLLVQAQGRTVVVRPVEIQDVLVNPGMGIQTFQRFRGDPMYPGSRWSEVGPEGPTQPAPQPPDFPDSSVAYCRWFWWQIEPEPGKYRWEILDAALETARQRGQTLDIRLMPYDQSNPLPEWYRRSGARRANKPEDPDGKIWSPDANDPLYLKHWGALVRAAGARYDGHPYLNSVDISTVGYWGEGWGPYLPEWPVQQALIDVYFEAFRRTPLLMNFDEPRALAYGVGRGAGWRLDCWGDLGGRGKGFMHMLDLYPQQVVRTGIQDAWQRSPVSLETCGTPLSWKSWGYTEREVRYSIEQALRWHASTINIKSTAIPAEWKPLFDEFQKKLGYRFVLRKLEYPSAARRGHMMPVSMWWLNAGVAPVYREYWLALELRSASHAERIRLPVDVRKWLPGDAVYDGSVYVPDTLEPGSYRLRIALLDPRTGQPAIRLAIEGRQADGWYDMGAIQVLP